MSARRFLGRAFASWLVFMLLHTGALAAGQPAANAAAPDKSDAQTLFLELSARGKVADAQTKFNALRALADQGDPQAVAFVAALSFGQDNAVALDYLVKGLSASPSFASEGHLVQGFQCNGGFNERAAADKASQLLQSATANAADKQTALIIQGLLAQYGGGGFQVSKLKALDYYKQAADQGSGLALALQGRIYEFDGGKEVPVDKTKAMALYKAAAEKNDPQGLFLYALLKKELEGDRKTWESALRRAIDVGAHAGAMAELGYDLITRAGATKEQIEEGRTLIEWGYRLRGTYATLNLGLLAENGKLPNLDSPAGVAYMFYRQLAPMPCGSPDGPNAIVKLLPKLESAPPQVLAKLNSDGMSGIMNDLIDHFPNVKAVRDAVWVWAQVPHADEDDFVDYLSGAGHEKAVQLLLTTGYARMRYDAPADLQSPDRFADALATAIGKLAAQGELAFSDLGQTNLRVDASLAANSQLDAQSRAEYASAIKRRLASTNASLQAEYARRNAPPEPTPATSEQLAAARACYDDSADFTRREQAYEQRADDYKERRKALDEESDSIDTEQMLVDAQVQLVNNMTSMGYKNTDNGSARANLAHLNNRIDAYNRQNVQLNKVGARLEKEREQLRDAYDAYHDRCHNRKFNMRAVKAVCGDTLSNSRNKWCNGFEE